MSENTKDCDCTNPTDQQDPNCSCDHEHTHEQPGCGCDHDHDHEHEHEEPRKIYLTLTDGNKLECHVLDIFEVQKESYIALLPSGSETALLYGFIEDDEGPQLRNIEDDEEYKGASKVFMDRQEV